MFSGRAGRNFLISKSSVVRSLRIQAGKTPLRVGPGAPASHRLCGLGGPSGRPTDGRAAAGSGQATTQLAAAGQVDFDTWLRQLRRDAIAEGIPAGHPRRGAGRHRAHSPGDRARPQAAGNHLDLRRVHRAGGQRAAPRQCPPADRGDSAAAQGGRPPLRRPAALHRRAVGDRDRFRTTVGHLSGHRRAGDPGV